MLGHRLLQQILQEDGGDLLQADGGSQNNAQQDSAAVGAPNVLVSPLLLHSVLTIGSMGARGRCRRKIASLLMGSSARAPEDSGKWMLLTQCDMRPRLQAGLDTFYMSGQCSYSYTLTIWHEYR